MTRINLIPVNDLTRKHLLAEYRELPRVFALVRAAQERGDMPADVGIPLAYRMGKGHVKFFYDKLRFLVARQRALIDEMMARGFHVSFPDPDSLTVGIRECWMNDWSPDDDALRVSRARIEERLTHPRRGVPTKS